jgi:hypothetical protein
VPARAWRALAICPDWRVLMHWMHWNSSELQQATLTTKCVSFVCATMPTRTLGWRQHPDDCKASAPWFDQGLNLPLEHRDGSAQHARTRVARAAARLTAAPPPPSPSISRWPAPGLSCGATWGRSRLHQWRAA